MKLVYLSLIIGTLIGGVGYITVIKQPDNTTNEPLGTERADLLVVDNEGVSSFSTSSLTSLLATPHEQKSDLTVSDLLFMQQEEKLARDTYQFLYEKWGKQVFINITQSEQTHMEAVEVLLSAYQVDRSRYSETAFEYQDASLAALSTDLRAQGSRSLEDALRVGALIEEIDIVDLNTRIARTTDPAIITTYENLKRGSRNHLRAFTKNLSQLGITYSPTRISASEYQEIINTGIERGGGRGQSR